MSKYQNVKEVMGQVEELDKLYMKAKMYDKITNLGKIKLRCSLCGIPQDKVQRLLTNNNLYICEHCVALLDNICSKEVEGYNELKELVGEDYE